MSDLEVTPEMRVAVAREECGRFGHDLEHVFALDSMAPKLVICGHCGSEWRIHPDDEGRDWGT